MGFLVCCLQLLGGKADRLAALRTEVENLVGSAKLTQLGLLVERAALVVVGDCYRVVTLRQVADQLVRCTAGA